MCTRDGGGRRKLERSERKSRTSNCRKEGAIGEGKRGVDAAKKAGSPNSNGPEPDKAENLHPHLGIKTATRDENGTVAGKKKSKQRQPAHPALARRTRRASNRPASFNPSQLRRGETKFEKRRVQGGYKKKLQRGATDHLSVPNEWCGGQ